MPRIADDARFFIRGDEGAAGFGLVVGEDEVVEPFVLGFYFFELGAEAEGAGFALGDAGCWFGDDILVFVHFVGELLDEGAGDAIREALRGGGDGEGEVADFAGFQDERRVAQFAPFGEAEVAGCGVRLVALVAEPLCEESPELVADAFDIGFLFVFVLRSAGDVHAVRLAVVLQRGEGGVEGGDFGGEDGRVYVEPDHFSLGEIEEVAGGFEHGEPVGEFVFHRSSFLRARRVALFVGVARGKFEVVSFF